MQELVKITESKEVVTDSLTVAKYFKKNHKEVLRAIKSVIEAGIVHERNFALMEMKIKSWLKRIWDKWFPEIKGGINPKSDNGKVLVKHKKYPVCRGEHLQTNIPIRKKAIN